MRSMHADIVNRMGTVSVRIDSRDIGIA
jgi:hypothetical protein